MSSEITIRAKQLCKEFRVYRRPEDRFKQILWRNRRTYFTPVHAVKDFDLEIRRGETFGIVGRNGSGKSTFLQMVCGIFPPTTGTIEVRGRVAGLLELGAGFNPEFTGRENVFLNAAVLGLTEDEIKEKFEDMIRFADIGEFIDQPVKNYSSGMFARLAFAVAINVNADILIIDEALSVGDEAFQRKCFSKIQEFSDNGATVLFVSHAANTIVELCDRAMLLDQGENLIIDTPKTVIDLYQRMIYAPPEKTAEVRQSIIDGTWSSIADTQKEEERSTQAFTKNKETSESAYFDPNLLPQTTTEYVSRGCKVSDVRIQTLEGEQVNVLSMGSTYEYSYRASFDQQSHKVRFGMLMKLLNGWEMGGMASHPVGSGVPVIEAGSSYRITYRFRADMIPGAYFMNAGVVGSIDGAETHLHRILDVLMFRVNPVENNCVTGYVDFSAEPFCQVEEEGGG